MPENCKILVIVFVDEVVYDHLFLEIKLIISFAPFSKLSVLPFILKLLTCFTAFKKLFSPFPLQAILVIAPGLSVSPVPVTLKDPVKLLQPVLPVNLPSLPKLSVGRPFAKDDRSGFCPINVFNTHELPVSRFITFMFLVLLQFENVITVRSNRRKLIFFIVSIFWLERYQYNK